MLQGNLLDLRLRPLKGGTVFIVGFGEPGDGPPQLPGRSEAPVSDHSGGQDAEPNFNLIEPAGIGRGVVKVHVGVTGEPGTMFLLVGREVIQHHVQFLIRGIPGDEVIHKVKEFTSAAAAVVPGPNHPGGYL